MEAWRNQEHLINECFDVAYRSIDKGLCTEAWRTHEQLCRSNFVPRMKPVRMLFWTLLLPEYLEGPYSFQNHVSTVFQKKMGIVVRHGAAAVVVKKGRWISVNLRPAWPK